MAWLIAALALVLAGAVLHLVTRGRRAAALQSMTERRVDAYMQTIRREQAPPALAAMTDGELSDLLLSAIHNLRVERERRMWLLGGVAGATLVVAILVATQDGMRGFALALLVGGLAIYGLNEFLGRRMREPLAGQGIDVERLKIE